MVNPVDRRTISRCVQDPFFDDLQPETAQKQLFNRNSPDCHGKEIEKETDENETSW
jgi:hypothetical protein